MTSSPRSRLFMEHDLFRKPVSTFRDHALTSSPPDRLPDQQEDDGADRRGDQTAPEILHHDDVELLEQVAADEGTDQPDDDVAEQAVRRVGELRGDPAGEKPDRSEERRVGKEG